MRCGIARLGLAGALTLGLCAMAGAQTAPASEPARPQWPCEATNFETLPIAVPRGVKVPPQGVTVRVQLEYADLSAEPAVTVTFNSGDQMFADAVIAIHRRYRFDCVKSGPSPVRFYREIQFVGGERPEVLAGAVRPLVARSAHCYKNASGEPRPANPPPWASSAVGERPGLVILEMTFRGPDVAPEAGVLFSRSERRFESAVLDWVAGHRWPCMNEGDRPVKSTQVFKYLPDGREPVPNQGSLQQFLGAVDKMAEHKVRFDFTTMGCPFKFRLRYLRPYVSNDVTQIDSADPNRREFRHWLEQVSFKAELNPGNELVGRDFEVSVPCLVLDLR